MTHTTTTTAHTTPVFTPYRKRSLSYFETLFVKDWHIKTYGISAHTPRPPQSMLKSLLKLAPEIIQSIGNEFETYQLAFAILHEANDGDFILFFWWTGENMLASRVFYASERGAEYKDIQDTHIAACIWELEIIKYERDLWTSLVLGNKSNGDFSAYLANHMKVPHV